MTRRSDHEVIIAGGGPVGLGLAIELGQRGHSVAVVERYPQPSPIPKGQNLTQRTMESFHFWGAEGALRAARTVPPGHGIGGMTAYGTLLSDYHYDWLQREFVRPYYMTDNERLPQYRTEAVLRARAAELPSITTFYGWEAGSLEDGSGGVTLAIAERDGPGRQALTGRFLVGCDGARSRVREQAGIGETRRDHDRRMVLIVFRSRGLHELLERYPGKAFFNVLHPDLEGYWMFFGRVDLGETWFFHAPVPPGTTRDNFDFTALLHRAVGASFDVAFEHLGFWDLRIAVADAYGRGRIFIAGDAAHSHPPYGGYGINTGFEDARNLGWKLSAVLEGWGGPALLDSYDAERRPVFVSTAEHFIEKFIFEDRDFLARHDPSRDRADFEAAWARRAEGSSDDVFAFEPNYRGSPVVCHPGTATPGAQGRHVFRARAGHHLAPMPLSDGRNLFEAVGPGLTLVATGAPEAEVAAFEMAAARLGQPLAVIRDTAAEGRETWDAPLILLRPDQFVAWCGETRDAPEAILRRASGHPPG